VNGQTSRTIRWLGWGQVALACALGSLLLQPTPAAAGSAPALQAHVEGDINTITVGQSEQPGVSRMTLVVDGSDNEVEQAGKQLYKLMEVLKVADVTDQPVLAYEMAMVKIATKPQSRAEIMLIAQIYNARVIDASPSSLVLEATGPQEQIDSFLAMVRPFGVREMVRTGPIAMVRGGTTVAMKNTIRTDRVADAGMAAD